MLLSILVLLLVLLALGCLLNASHAHAFAANLATFQITNNDHYDGIPRFYASPLSGYGQGWVVWASLTGPALQSDIMRFDLATRSTTALTTDGQSNRDPHVTTRGDVVWLKGDGSESELYAYIQQSAFTLRITDNVLRDDDLAVEGDLVAYVRYGGMAKPSQVCTFHLPSRGGRLMESDSLWDEAPSTDGEWVAWMGWDGHDHEIYLWDGDVVRRLTDNAQGDGRPQVCDRSVTWSHHDGADYEIWRYEDGAITYLTNNAWDDIDPVCASGPGGDYIAWNARTAGVQQLFLASRPIGATAFTAEQVTTGAGDKRRYSISETGLAWDEEIPYCGGMEDWEIMFRDHEGWVSTVTNNSEHDYFVCLSGYAMAWMQGHHDAAEIFLAVPDNEVPTATMETPSPAAVLGGAPGSAAVIKGTASDDVAVATVHVSTDGGTTWADAVIDSGRDTPLATWHYDWPLPEADYVNYRLQVQVVDRTGYGFIPAACTRDVVVDTVAPRFGSFALNGGASVTFSDVVNADLEAEDGSPVLETRARNAGGTWGVWAAQPEGGFPWRLAPGTGPHTVEVMVRDAGRNEAGPWTADITVMQGVFRDVSPGHQYSRAVYELLRAGVISGYDTPSGWEFRPANHLWRAQFAKMIAGVLGLPVSEEMTSPFVDLGEDDVADLYPHEFVAAAYAVGITVGTTSTTFAPWTDITRAQLVTMVVRAAESRRPGMLAPPPASWTCSLGAFDSTHGPTMRTAEYNGMLDGLVGFGPAWDPWRPASRGEAAHLLYTLALMGGS